MKFICYNCGYTEEHEFTKEVVMCPNCESEMCWDGN